jgi:murein L,D-transpeptidase YafK
MKVLARLAVTLAVLILGTFALVLIWANYRVQPLPTGARADKVVVDKSQRRLVLLQQGKPLKVYQIALGPKPVGHKECEGDGRTPEGSYRIDFRKLNSTFHRALHVSYPNAHDIQVAKSRGVNPGGAIMIHGLGKSSGWYDNLHYLVDWTAGCIAVTNSEIEELWRAVPDGCPVEIRP